MQSMWSSLLLQEDLAQRILSNSVGAAIIPKDIDLTTAARSFQSPDE